MACPSDGATGLGTADPGTLGAGASGEASIGRQTIGPSRFGPAALTPNEPVSNLRRKFVPIWLLHRYQVEAALLLVEPIAHVGEPEKILLQRIQEEHLPCVLCINKIDTVEKKDDLLAVIAAYSQAFDGFDAIIPISARTGDGLEDLQSAITWEM